MTSGIQLCQSPWWGNAAEPYLGARCSNRAKYAYQRDPLLELPVGVAITVALACGVHAKAIERAAKRYSGEKVPPNWTRAEIVG